jgi:hypothetical protein
LENIYEEKKFEKYIKKSVSNSKSARESIDLEIKIG